MRLHRRPDLHLKLCELTAAPVVAGDSFEATTAWTGLLLEWCQWIQGDIADRRSRSSAILATLDAIVMEILGTAGVETAEDFELCYEEQTARVGSARERLQTARLNAQRAEMLDRELNQIEPIAIALGQLNKYLQNRSFKDFVMRRRERRLLGIGTEMLREMTGGRYAFAEGFEIMDYHADRVRSAKTLSGGETFLASLSLALALVEVASRTGGKLDALFLDEGFGNLDAAALDEALSELSERAKTGKMIGIVTHVRGIAEQIDTILRVERRATGSVIERLEGATLGDFMEDRLAGFRATMKRECLRRSIAVMNVIAKLEDVAKRTVYRSLVGKSRTEIGVELDKPARLHITGKILPLLRASSRKNGLRNLACVDRSRIANRRGVVCQISESRRINRNKSRTSRFEACGPRPISGIAHRREDQRCRSHEAPANAASPPTC